MSDWRRVFVPGGTDGFTLVTERRAPIFTDPVGRTILRETLRDCRRQWPFEIIAIVLLPDHLHTLWRLPDGDCAYPRRVGWVKKEFTKAWLAGGGAEQPVSASRWRHRRRGVLQRKFWEHCIRGDHDLHRHLDYLHYNPVKHGYVGALATGAGRHSIGTFAPGSMPRIGAAPSWISPTSRTGLGSHDEFAYAAALVGGR